jgi:hypothetical protein
LGKKDRRKEGKKTPKELGRNQTRKNQREWENWVLH